MQEENKPYESDTSDDTDFENLDDLFEESVAEAGDEDVASAPAALSVEQLQKLTGRTDITTIAAFEKHYTNLKSFVGKKTEAQTATKVAPVATEQQSSPELRQILENQQKIEFFMDTPEAKTHFEEYVKPLAQGKGISYAEAWAKIQPLVAGSQAKEREKTVGINSKNRIAPIDTSQVNSLREAAAKGSPEAQEKYIAAMLGMK